MVEKPYKKPERAPSHPGSVLRSGFVDEYGLHIESVAAMLGLTRVHLSRILNARAPITPDIALKLEMLTRTPASQWLAMQSKYDAYQMEQDQEFRQYKQTLSKWLSNSLPMQPKQRREDATSRELVAEAARLAKQMSSRKTKPA